MSEITTAIVSAAKSPAGALSAAGISAPLWWTWVVSVLPVVGQVIMFVLGLVIAVLTIWNKVLEIRSRRKR